MSTSLRDLLADPALGLSPLVAGDIDRPIRWVHVTELADASPYLAGNELVLTAGVWRGRGTSALDFVRALETRSVAGIAYGLLDAAERVPEALIRACRDEGVPLVVVPVTTPFIAISQWFVDHLANEREAEVRKTLRLTQDLIAAADASSSDEALRSVARLLRQATGRNAWISDPSGRVLARSGSTEHAAAGAARSAVAAGRRAETVSDAGSPWLVRFLHSGSRTTAVMGLAGTEDDLVVRGRLDAALPVVGLVFARERAIRESERRLAGELVSLVLSRQQQAAEARLVTYGLDPGGALLAIVCAVPDGDRSLTAAEDWLARAAGTDGVVALRGEELYAVLDASHVGSPLEAGSIAAGLVRDAGALAAGVGAVSAGLGRLRRSLVQAQQACELARRRGGGTVLSHELAGSHALLLALQDEDVIDAFRDALLAPLEDYEQRHGTDLLATLRAFLSSGGRWQQTADELKMHVNTLRHRLERVEQLTGRKLDATSDRVDLWLALESSAARPTRSLPAPRLD
jgi:purine catabolism regulator